MAKIGLPKGSGKRLKVREKSVKSQGILKWILSGNPDSDFNIYQILRKIPLCGISSGFPLFVKIKMNFRQNKIK